MGSTMGPTQKHLSKKGFEVIVPPFAQGFFKCAGITLLDAGVYKIS